MSEETCLRITRQSLFSIHAGLVYTNNRDAVHCYGRVMAGTPCTIPGKRAPDEKHKEREYEPPDDRAVYWGRRAITQIEFPAVLTALRVSGGPSAHHSFDFAGIPR